MYLTQGSENKKRNKNIFPAIGFENSEIILISPSKFVVPFLLPTIIRGPWTGFFFCKYVI